MEDIQTSNLPSQCASCGGDLVATRLECVSCGTEVNGRFALGRLATLREPHASLIEMFLRARGNVKEMERELGLSYPTVRARLDEAFTAAGFERTTTAAPEPGSPEWAQDLEERIRSRIEERLAGLGGRINRAARDSQMVEARKAILDRLERGEIVADEAATLLRELKKGR